MLQRIKNQEDSGLSLVPDDGDTQQRLPVSLPAVKPGAASTDAKPAGVLKRNRARLMAMAAVLVLAGAGWFGYHYATVGRFMVSTDDAYVRANNTTLGAKVAGYVAAITVEDNAPVQAGDVIARIDDGDYRLAVTSARDKVATQQATVERFEQQIVAQQAAVDQAKAQLASANAAQVAHASRVRSATGAGGQGVRQQADAWNRRSPGAIRQSPRCAVREAEVDGRDRQVGVLQAQKQEALGHARRAQDRAGQGRARSVIYRDPGAGRWRHRQPRGAGRRFRANRPAGRRDGAIVGRISSTPTSRRRSLPGCIRASRCQ